MTLLHTWRARGRARRIAEIAECEAPTAADKAWLEEQAARDPSVAARHASIRRWHELARSVPPTCAPGGFAERVVLRARQEPAPVVAARTSPRWGWAGVAAAAGVAAFVVLAPVADESADIARSGSPGWSADASPDLIIEAQKIGAVEARDAFEATVRDHGGQVERYDGAVVARIARDRLLPLLRALAEHGPFDVTRAAPEGTALPATLTLRLELGAPATD